MPDSSDREARSLTLPARQGGRCVSGPCRRRRPGLAPGDAEIRSKVLRKQRRHTSISRIGRGVAARALPPLRGAQSVRETTATTRSSPWPIARSRTSHRLCMVESLYPGRASALDPVRTRWWRSHETSGWRVGRGKPAVAIEAEGARPPVLRRGRQRRRHAGAAACPVPCRAGRTRLANA